jgi:hypothetical protein
MGQPEDTSRSLHIEIGSPQWRYHVESVRTFKKFLEDKLADDRQYLGDPMMRAEDEAWLQFVKDEIADLELQEELSTNPSPERIAEINAQCAAFPEKHAKDLAFLKRLETQRHQRFEQLRKLNETAGQSPEQHDSAKSSAPSDQEILAHPRVSMTDAAQVLGRSVKTVYRLVDEGKLEKKRGMIVTASLLKYMNE